MKRSTLLSLGLLLMLVLSACQSSSQPTSTVTSSTDPSTTIESSTTTTAIAPVDETSTSIPTSTAGPGGGDIAIRMFQFTPDRFTIDAGQSVTWINSDRIDHTVTSGTPDNPTTDFDVALPEAGATATVAFEEPGTYDYFCGIHPHMRGTVVVESAS